VDELLALAPQFGQAPLERAGMAKRHSTLTCMSSARLIAPFARCRTRRRSPHWRVFGTVGRRG
jgi:hypothetical protein